MKKFAIIYGSSLSPLRRRAVEELTAMLLEYTDVYPVCLKSDDGTEPADLVRIYIGTAKDNAYIGASSKNPTKSEGYALTVRDNTVIIEGADEAGVLYGAIDFYNVYVVKHEHPDNDRYWENFLLSDRLPDFEYSSAPSVRERGLWTWGHVMYDYKGYLDNMMRLKLNRVIIWNDHLPDNAREIVEYAHGCGIKVIWGFSWLWDTRCDLVDLNSLDGCSEKILERYEKEYSEVSGDGIYFQTFTELKCESVSGVLIAEAAAKFVNRTAALFYEKYPELEIQFGLHATSVKDRLEFIARVDKRIRIVWEDCGAFPFSYIPKEVADFEDTMDFVEKIAVLRGEDDLFGVVTKGLTKLDWESFEHQGGPQNIGVSRRAFKGGRIEKKRRIWRYLQAYWLVNSDKAKEAVHRMRLLKGGELLVCALVEDGVFEENISYPVALFSEILWNADADIRQLMSSVALRSYITFA